MLKKCNVRSIVSSIILVVIIATSCSGCAYIKAFMTWAGSTTNSGTNVQGNSLHAGKKETNTTGTDYTNVGKVNHHYMRQTGDYVLRGVGLLGLLALVGFIVLKFFKFLRFLLIRK